MGWGLWSEMGAFASFGVGKVWGIHFLGATEIGVWGRGIVLGVSEKARHLWGRDGSLVVPETCKEWVVTLKRTREAMGPCVDGGRGWCRVLLQVMGLKIGKVSQCPCCIKPCSSPESPQSPQFLQSPQFPQFLQSDIQFSE